MTDPVSPTTDSSINASGPPQQAQADPPPKRSAAEIASAAVVEQPPAKTQVADDTTPISLLSEDETAPYTDAERLTASPLEEWFPGIEWRTLVTWLGGTCFQSTDGTLTLIVENGGHTAAGAVRYTRSGPWEGGVIGFWGPVVNSAAEIGELLREDDA